MLDKLYPKDQIKNYLLIDFVLIVFLFYRVLRLDGALGLWSSLMLLLLFLVSFYFALWRRDGGLLAAVLSGLFVLAVLAVYIGPVILWFGFIFADLLGRSRSKGHIAIGSAGIALSFMFVFIIRKEPLLQISNAVYLPVMIIQTVYPIVIYIKEKTKSLQGELDAANEQIAKFIQQEERQRIARDLHDILGQTLMMIKLKSELATKWVDKDTAQAKRELGDILATSRTAIKQVRELVSEMKFISLPGELEHSVELLRTAGIALYIEYHGKTPLLSSVEETMLSLCVREATTNIIKHSGAKQCTITLEVKEQSYVIHITDDGKGVAQQEGGNGIPSMVERMQILGGSFAICPSPAGGTVLSLKLPIHQHEKEDDS
ncbi:histidine kinase [Paenibacillus glucanolyticus]|uniref:histidine kinase n=1 Tax=Paenibacillus glucanolyticus TaxID=59843 RepID=A0A163D9X9_9BACL|nr:sensor histidine kinase [Paenibacillus glucanolyticus]KZS43090.1 histidine kinase [Paenibacillus glucanolyticus]